MCGIIGYVGHQQAAPILLDGLARMEYRGYDSAGVAVRSETKGLQVYKSKGRLQVLSDMIHGGADVEGTLGIGHTRWATHGEPNDINAHPHVSEDGRIAMVHNGIIENYMEIKQQLLRHGVTFKSETDTEVAAQLLEFHYNECHNMLEAVGRVLRRIEGSYAFGIICADYPNALIAARKDSPLIIGCGENENFIASDVTAVISHTRDVIYMEDGEIAVLTAEGVNLFNDEMDPIDKPHSHIDCVPGTAARGILYPMSAPNFGMIPQPLGRTPLSLRSGWNLRNLTRTCVTYSSAGTSLPGASCWRTSPSWAPTIFPQSGNSSARKMGKCGIPTIKSWQKT